MRRDLAVGLNLLYLVRDSGGAGRYARELVPALLEQESRLRITAFVSSEAPQDFLDEPWASDVEFVTVPIRVTQGPPWNAALSLGAQWALLPLLARRRKLDVLHGLANIVPLVAPGVATVATVLDLIWLTFPNTMSRRATVGMRLAVPPSARRATRVIAISEAAKRDLVARLGPPASKIDVTPLGVSRPSVPPVPEIDTRRRYELGERSVVMTVAQKREHKNLAGLLRAFARLDDATVLLLPGSPTPHERELRRLAADLGIAGRVRFLPWLSDDELEALYRAATVFVLPSFEEGFGLPVLEAMARGVPAACANVPALSEVAGDAAELFDPSSPDAMAIAISRVLGDGGLRQTLIERGRRRCGAFTWERTARATLASYQKALETVSAPPA